MFELELRDISVHYNKTEVLKGNSLQINNGEAVCLLGPNGAGKTTTLKAICGLKRLSSGEIWFEGKRIDNTFPQNIVRLGIIQIPEGKRLFPNMTVYENLLMGAYLRNDRGGIRKSIGEIYGYFRVLGERKNQKACTLSGGEQQMLAIARAMMARPKLLLLDEPSIGLSPLIIVEVARIITNISQGGITIFLVEQNARLCFRLTQRGYLLVKGRIELQGSTADLEKDEYVKKAYLGG